MKQLEFNFEAVPEVVNEEKEYFVGSRIYLICREEAKQQLKEIEAGRAFASQRYKKMLKSY